MSSFRFNGELFAARAAAQEALLAAGFNWFEDYGSIDLKHDLDGLEISGIPSREKALLMLVLLKLKFPHWRHNFLFEDTESIDAGWQFRIHRLCEPPAGP